MGRPHQNIAVVCAFDANGQKIGEDLIPLPSYRCSGSLMLNCQEFRRAKGIRFTTVRLFDEAGCRIENYSRSYALDGREVKALHRRPDGTIIEESAQ